MMAENNRLEKILNGALTAAALAVAFAVLRRELRPPPSADAASTREAVTAVEDWADALKVGQRVGAANAKVRIVEFADFECPACSVFHARVDEVLKRYPNEVALIFVHYPLSIHRFAVPAARAAECAAKSGRFHEFASVLFDKQDSIGLKTWQSFAKDAEIPDPQLIGACATDNATVERIEAGRAMGKRLEVQYTPTIVVEGWRLPGLPSKETLIEAIEAVLKGRAPAGASQAATSTKAGQ